MNPRLAVITVALLLTSTPNYAITCDSLRSQIDSKIKAAGVEDYTLTTVEVGAKVTGTIVGSCELGSKKIVYSHGEASNDSTASSPSSHKGNLRVKRDEEPILTECKDGTVKLGGDCQS